MLVESFGCDPLTIRADAFHSGAVLKQFSFSSERKMMSTLVALPGGGVRMFTTGGSDYILARSTSVLQVRGGERRLVGRSEKRECISRNRNTSSMHESDGMIEFTHRLRSHLTTLHSYHFACVPHSWALMA